MKKSKKGFTMVELLATIVILGILAAIVLAVSTNITKDAKKKYCTSQEALVTLSGKDYFADNRSKLPKEIGGTSQVSLKTLVDEAYIKEVVDSQGKACDYDSSYVSVQKQGEQEYNYYTYLKCGACESGSEGMGPTIAFSPNSKSSNQEITVTMTVKDDKKVETYSYTIYKDGASYKTVSETYNKAVTIKLSETGTYQITGMGYDNDGNVASSTSGNYVISKTTANCKTTITSKVAPKTWTKDSIEFTLQFADGVTDWEWYVSKDGKDFVKKGNYKPSLKNMKISGDGIYKVRVISYDKYGNRCQVDSNQYYIGDEITEVTLQGSVPTGELTNEDVVLTAVPSPENLAKPKDEYSFQIKVGNNWEDYQTSYSKTTSVSDEDLQTFRVVVKTELGKQVTSNTYQTKIDKTPPSNPTVTAKYDTTKTYSFGSWINKNVTVTPSGSKDAVSGFSHYLYRTKKNSEAYSEYKRLEGSSVALNQDGTYTVEFVACDKLNNCGKTPVSKVVKIDKTSPTTPVIESMDTPDWTTMQMTLTMSTKETGSGVEYWMHSFDNSSWSPFCTGKNLPNSSCVTLSSTTSYLKNNDSKLTNVTANIQQPNHKTIYFKVKDVAGNYSGTTKNTSVPLTPPEIVGKVGSANYTSNTWTNKSVTLQITSDIPDLSEFSVLVNDMKAGGERNKTIRVPAVGSMGTLEVPAEEYVDKTYMAMACNSQGKCMGGLSNDFRVKIDTVPPTCTVNDPGDYARKVQEFDLIGRCTDEHSKCKEAEVSTKFNLDEYEVISGVYTPGVVEDNAGNQTNCDDVTLNLYYVELKPPTASFYKHNPGSTVRQGRYVPGSDGWSNKPIQVNVTNPNKTNYTTVEYRSSGDMGTKLQTYSSLDVTQSGTSNLRFRVCLNENLTKKFLLLLAPPKICSDWTDFYKLMIDTEPPTAPTIIAMRAIGGFVNKGYLSSGQKEAAVNNSGYYIFAKGSSDNHSGLKEYEYSTETKYIYTNGYTTSTTATGSCIPTLDETKGPCTAKQGPEFWNHDGCTQGKFGVNPDVDCNIETDAVGNPYGDPLIYYYHFRMAEEGLTYSVSYRACDNVGNCSAFTTWKVENEGKKSTPTPEITRYQWNNNDSTPPTSSTNLSKITSDIFWSNKKVFVKFTSNQETNVNHYEYTLSGAQKGSGKGNYVNITTEGTTTIEVKACTTTNSISCSSPVEATVKIDWTPPTFSSFTVDPSSYKFGTWSNREIALTANFKDTLSGVNENTITYSYKRTDNVRSGEYNEKTHTFYDGIYDVQVKATDHAGNESAYSTKKTLQIDTSTPYTPQLVGMEITAGGAKICEKYTYCEYGGKEYCPSKLTYAVSNVTCHVVISNPNGHSTVRYTPTFKTPGPSNVNNFKYNYTVYDPPNNSYTTSYDWDANVPSPPTIDGDGALSVTYSSKNGAGTVSPTLRIIINWVTEDCGRLNYHSIGGCTIN